MSIGCVRDEAEGDGGVEEEGEGGTGGGAPMAEGDTEVEEGDKETGGGENQEMIGHLEEEG